MTPLLSIIIPAYNSVEFLAHTLESVLAQTLAAIEVIVIDDGSTDDTRGIAEKFLETGKVRLFSQKNSGPCEARNAGLDRAKGRYVAFLDSDDLWHPRKAELHCRLMEAEPDIDLTWSGWCVIDKAGRYTGRSRPDFTGRADLTALIQNNFIGNGDPVIRREAVEAAGRFDPRMAKGCEDWDLWLRIAALREGHMVFVPGVLVAYRRRPDQLSSKWQSMDAYWCKLLEAALARWPERIAPVAEAAHARFETYLAYLNIESGSSCTAAELLLRASRRAPSAVVRDKSFWRVSAAAAAGLALPPRWSAALRDKAHLLLFHGRTEPSALEWDRDRVGLRRHSRRELRS